MKLLIIFIVLNVVNVINQTVKSLATVKCGKTVAAIVNAIAYGLYTVVVVYTMCDLPLWAKALIVGVANLIGVYIVKLFEEKARKDKLWLVKITIPKEKTEQVKSFLEKENIPFSYYNITKYFVFDTYCENQNQTKKVLNICKSCNGKAFATENKLGL